jgi:cytochrome c5
LNIEQLKRDFILEVRNKRMISTFGIKIEPHYPKRWMKTRSIIYIVLVLAAVACKSKKLTNDGSNTEEVDTETDSTLVEVKKEPTKPVVLSPKEFYARKCGSCHDLYAPEQFTAAEWKVNLNKMQKRAMISDKNKYTLYTYLTNGEKWNKE